VRKHDGTFRENMMLAGPTEWVGTRFAQETEPHTLYHLDHGRRWPDGVLVASEPLDDDPGWEPVPPGSLIRIDASGCTIERLF
jgi:glutamine amidotransferase